MGRRTYSRMTPLSSQVQSPCCRTGAAGPRDASASQYWYARPLASRAIQTRCERGLHPVVSAYPSITDSPVQAVLTKNTTRTA